MIEANKKSRPVSIYLLIAIIIFQGISGILGGFGLAMDPTGESLHIPISLLEGSPFQDYLIPGLILLIVLGLFPLAVSLGLMKKARWSWFGALMVGLALIVWIGVEIVIIGYQPQPPLQLIYGSVGLIILVFVQLSSVQRYLRTKAGYTPENYGAGRNTK